MRIIVRFAQLIVAVSLLSGCTEPSKTLSSADRKMCVAEGGFESRGPFGYPICQLRYADGGTICSDKADCTGRCLLNLDSDPPGDPIPQPGRPAKGQCEAERSTFGCFAVVVGGKVTSEGAVCVD